MTYHALETMIDALLIAGVPAKLKAAITSALEKGGTVAGVKRAAQRAGPMLGLAIEAFAEKEAKRLKK